MGVPQDGVLSSLLFVLFFNDFLMNEDCSFKVEDDSSIVVNGKTTDDLMKKLGESCALNRNTMFNLKSGSQGRQNIFFFCDASDNKAIMINGGPCQIRFHTISQ